MPASDLGIYISNAQLELEERLPEVIEREASLDDTLNVCRLFRILAIGHLLLTGTMFEFQHNLYRSGRVFLYFLRGAPDDQKITSKALPFYDAIASGDLDCAKSISVASRMTWNEHEEYEEDFLYIAFLMNYFFLADERVRCKELLDRYLNLTRGQRDIRAELCVTFFENDPMKFEANLERLLHEYQERYQRLQSKGAISPEESTTEAKLCIEGLALIRLAEAKGYSLQSEFLLVPSIVRVMRITSYSENDWQ